MTDAASGAEDMGVIDDSLIALAILGVLAERTEIYPSHVVGELRRRAPQIPPERIRPVLEQLWAERRVARLWHRYLLPERVDTVRANWLAMIERRRDDLQSLECPGDGYADGRAIVQAWDGWGIPAPGFWPALCLLQGYWHPLVVSRWNYFPSAFYLSYAQKNQPAQMDLWTGLHEDKGLPPGSPDSLSAFLTNNTGFPGSFR